MLCDDILCIYCQNHQCQLDTIHINDLSMCDACIHILFTEAELETKRRETFLRYGDFRYLYNKKSRP